jgi:DNA-binding CsgD family transcriptional regulator
MNGELTPREREVLYWVAQGKTNPTIAIILQTSPRTIQKHLEHIYQKLGVESRTSAALAAVECGLVSRQELITPPDACDEQA